MIAVTTLLIANITTTDTLKCWLTDDVVWCSYRVRMLCEMWFTVAAQDSTGAYPSDDVHASATEGRAVHLDRLMLEALITTKWT